MTNWCSCMDGENHFIFKIRHMGRFLRSVRLQTAVHQMFCIQHVTCAKCCIQHTSQIHKCIHLKFSPIFTQLTKMQIFGFNTDEGGLFFLGGGAPIIFSQILNTLASGNSMGQLIESGTIQHDASGNYCSAYIKMNTFLVDYIFFLVKH